jgi:hypothetical protein
MNASFRGFSFLNSLARAQHAKARLSEMITQEVSMVDAAANLRRFVVVKRNNTMADEQVAKVALRLPPEAKRGIMDGLATALDKLTALATVVGDAEEDEQVFVPSDLGDALRQCAELVGGLAAQYVPAQPEQPTEEAPAEPEAAPSEPGVPDAIAAPAEPAMMGKALPPAETTPLTLAPQNEPLTMAPQTKAMIADAFKAIAGEIAETAKAGRKIAGQRYKKLAELHDTLGKLLNELAYDDAAGAAGLGSEAEGAPAAKACASDGKKTKKDEPVAKAADPKLAEVLALTKANAEKIEAIEKANRTPETPRARSAEGGGAPSTVWPMDMSAALAKRKRAEKAAR